MFELGALNAGDGDEATAQLQALLDANFSLLEVNAPVFSRNPASGDAVLQHVCPLFEASPNSLYELIDKEIERLSHWRENSALTIDDSHRGVLHQFA